MGKLVKNGIDYTNGTVDSMLSNTSKNPVQNKVVTKAINDIATIDSNGDLWIGNTQIWHIIDSDSYAALQTKANILYLVYPTPSS